MVVQRVRNPDRQEREKGQQPSLPWSHDVSAQHASSHEAFLTERPGVCSDQMKPDLMEMKERPCRLEGGAQADATSKSVEEVPVLTAP